MSAFESSAPGGLAPLGRLLALNTTTITNKRSDVEWGMSLAVSQKGELAR